jgi:glucose/arabinose dehydrogenase
MLRPTLGALSFILPLGELVAQNVSEIYVENCAGCHGPDLRGGSGPNLIDDTWIHGDDDESVTRAISSGQPEQEMPAFKETLGSAKIRTLVVYLHEQRARAKHQPAMAEGPSNRQVYRSREHAFQMEIIAENLDEPWSINWLPDGRMLVTEKSGQLRLITNNQLDPQPINGIPAVYNRGQGGLMEVMPHPNYSENGWIYLAYSDPAINEDGAEVSMTKIVRGRIRDHRWVEQEPIWQAPLNTYRNGGPHYGCRLAFDREGYLFFTLGERGQQEKAQDLALPNGKIYRIHDDGRIPKDNPFAQTNGAIPSIWSYGHRNPQGLVFEPKTGLLWETEHGPRGGDELNLIRPGANYGWPIITYGINYNGTPITASTSQEGMEQPIVHWTPSPAVCGIDFYTGLKFPRWNGNLFVTALAGQHLRRLVVDSGHVIDQEVLLQDIGRVRDVASGPDGMLYFVLNRPGKVVRLVPLE